ncbi:hypothetical protein ACHQM5_010689 [Ranunculus cassubicifolius]
MSRSISLPFNTDHWSKLDDGTTESILARLPFIDLFRFQLVAKNWDSMIQSSTFHKACKELANRLPWFFMLNADVRVNTVYDVEVSNWRQCRLPFSLNDMHPLTSSNSLICAMTGLRDLTVCNPLTGSQRMIAESFLIDECIDAITLRASGSSYKVYVVWTPTVHSFVVDIYSSEDNTWTHIPMEEENLVTKDIDQVNENINDRFPVVVEQNIDFSCSTKLSGVSTIDSNGRETVYYLFRRERLISCDVHQGIAYRYPLLPGKTEDPSDVVECRGRILVVAKDIDADGKTSIRLSEFNHNEMKWKSVSTAPSHMSEIYSGIPIELDSSGHDDYVMICVFSVTNKIYDVLLYNIVEAVWVKLPPYFDHHTRRRQKFITPFAIMPDLNATA